MKLSKVTTNMNAHGIRNALKQYTVENSAFFKSMGVAKIAGICSYDINCMGRAYGLMERAKMFR